MSALFSALAALFVTNVLAELSLLEKRKDKPSTVTSLADSWSQQLPPPLLQHGADLELPVHSAPAVHLLESAGAEGRRH